MLTINDIEKLSLLPTQYNKLIIDYSASWCTPCKQIHPIVCNLQKEYPQIQFVQVDIDKADISFIKTVPTFHFFHNGKKVFELGGANSVKLKELTVQLNSTK